MYRTRIVLFTRICLDLIILFNLFSIGVFFLVVYYLNSIVTKTGISRYKVIITSEQKPSYLN